MARRTGNRRKGNKVFGFILEGETEFWYLNMLKRHERQLKIKFKPQLSSKLSIDRQFSLAKSMSEDFEVVFWIIDLDTLIEESRVTTSGQEKPIDKFKRFRNAILKDYPNVTVVVNNPCFEIWILLHFKFTEKPYSNCDEVRREIVSFIQHYEKTKDFYTKWSNDIYTRFKDQLEAAKSNSESIGSFDPEFPEKTLSEMFEVFNLLFGKQK